MIVLTIILNVLKHGENALKFTEGKYYFSLRKDVSARCKLTFLCNKVDSLLTDTLNWSLPCFIPSSDSIRRTSL